MSVLASCKIWTAQGVLFDILAPDPNLINLDDIGHTLSHLCRWGGRCSRFMSVAEHCCIVAAALETVSPIAARWGLLHDAAEAFIGDIPTPLKAALSIAGEPLEVIEERILRVVALRYDLPWPMPPEVLEEDLRTRNAEHAVLFQGLPLYKGDRFVVGFEPATAARWFHYSARHLGLKDPS